LNDITLAHEKEKGQNFLDRIKGKHPLFVCVIATTETAKIPGLSAAGANPEITDYTPPADAELLLLGKCRCIPGVPVTPDGIPTPALISMSALRLAEIPTLVINAGSKVKPMIPFIDLGGSPGKDIRTGSAVENVEEIFQNAQILGEQLAKTSDYLIVGESIPGGTTTALGVLLATGVDAKGKISSSMPNNPHELKMETVEAGLKSAQIHLGEMKEHPLRAIQHVGDPMMAAVAGIVVGSSNKVPVMMAGGTQMTSILATIAALNWNVLENVAIGTTRWITQDSKSDLRGIVSQIAKVPILAANIDFSSSKHSGLRIYETGIVKEGVGAGGSAIAAMAKRYGSITMKQLIMEIEKNYERLIGTQ
jgi:uncharacterized protein (TIGR00303 family)